MSDQVIEFIIEGNQEDPQGNPIGYHRTTQGSYWNEASKRYNAWKNYVVKIYSMNFPSSMSLKAQLAGKPIELEKYQKAYLHTLIYYANDARPDPDNVQKGIADALFLNDKNVAGSYDFTHAEDGKGKVLVKIIINEPWKQQKKTRKQK